MRPLEAIIDTQALIYNLNRVRTYSSHSKVMSVLKANAYGHGLIEVARALNQSEGFSVLNNKKEPLKRIGTLLNEQWIIKKTLTNQITNKNINDIYDIGIESGAVGGKLLGAGAGGFILFYVPKEKQNSVKDALKRKLFVPFRFDFTGSKIIYHSHQEK